MVKTDRANENDGKNDKKEDNKGEENALQKELNNFKEKKSKKNKKRKFGFGNIYNNPGIYISCLLLSSIVGGFGGGLIVQEFFRLHFKNNNSANIDAEAATDFGLQPTPQFSISSIAERNIKSIAQVTIESAVGTNSNKNYASSVGGSGIVVSEDGYILTNNQVVSGSGEIHINIGGEVYNAEIIGSDSELDIALLKIDKTGLIPVIFGNSDTLKLGETIIVLGNPLGNIGGSVTKGIISALSREITINSKTLNLIQVDRPINPSSYGGGLFNLQGELIGMTVYKKSSAASEGIGFAIPVDLLKKPLADLKEFGYIRGKIDIEIKISDLSLFKSSDLYKNYSRGVIVTNVPENSNAQAAGFKKGDCIISVNSVEISDSNSFRNAIKNYTAGDMIAVGIQRGEEYLTLNLQLAEKK